VHVDRDLWRLSGRRRAEIEVGAAGGAGDGEARQDALVDLSLAGVEAAEDLLGAVAHLLAWASLQRDDERGEIVLVGADEVGHAVGRQGSGLGGEEVTGDDDEERHGGPIIPAWHAQGCRWIGSITPVRTQTWLIQGKRCPE